MPLTEMPGRARAPWTIEAMSTPIRLGVSSCLLGNRVRYDAKHKRNAFIVERLGRHFEFVAVCPELAIGLGVPRPPIQLVGDARAPRALGVDDRSLDVTRRLAAYGNRQAHALSEISGYIFKSRSPSCGLADVMVHGRTGRATRRGTGIYAAAFRAARPLLPVEDEDALADPAARDNFIERVFANRRWQLLEAAGVTAARLREFHVAHALALMAHGPRRYAELARLAERARHGNVRRVAPIYLQRFVDALTRPATRRSHAAVLRRLYRRIRAHLTSRQRTRLMEAVELYRAAAAPRGMPIALFRRHFSRYPDLWVARQVYLYPDPRESSLRT